MATIAEKLAHLEAVRAARPADLAVGDEFHVTEADDYTENGEKRTHRFTYGVRITAIDDVTADYAVTELGDEQDAPTTFLARRPAPTGTVALFAIASYIARGSWVAE